MFRSLIISYWLSYHLTPAHYLFLFTSSSRWDDEGRRRSLVVSYRCNDINATRSDVSGARISITAADFCLSRAPPNVIYPSSKKRTLSDTVSFIVEHWGRTQQTLSFKSLGDENKSTIAEENDVFTEQSIPGLLPKESFDLSCRVHCTWPSCVSIYRISWKFHCCHQQQRDGSTHHMWQ